MSPYLILYFLVAVCALIGFNKKIEAYAYIVAFAAAMMMLMLRYGQGTDWLSYNYIFASCPDYIDFSDVFYTDAFHSEFGWKLLNNIWKAADQSFITLSIICSIIEMLLLNRFICKYSTNRAASLLIALPVVYLTYFFSAFRQGIVIAIFLGFLIPLLEEQKYGLFTMVTVGACLIHSAAILFLVIPFAMHIKRKQFSLLIVISVCLGMCLTLCLDKVLLMAGISYETSGVSWAALLYRSVMLVIVLLLYSDGENTTCEKLLKVYVVGFCIYVSLSCNQLLCSRMAAPFLALEIVLIPMLLKGQSRQGTLIFLSVVVLCSVMYVKNISASIEQGAYIQGVTVSNYPYVSIFNKNDLLVYSNNKYLIYLQ